MVRPTLGARLRKLREKDGINLRELGDATGIDFSLIGKYETGGRPLPRETYLRLLGAIEKVKHEREARERAIVLESEQKARAQSDTDNLVAAFQVAEKAGLPKLTRQQVVEVLGRLDLPKLLADLDSERSSLMRGLVVMRPLYDAIASIAQKSATTIELERVQQERERWQRYLLALDAFLDNPEKHLERGYDENSGKFWAKFTVPPYEGPIDQEAFDLDALNKRIDEKLRKFREIAARKDEERQRQIAALEKVRSSGFDNPDIAGVIESLRRENAEKDEQLEAMGRTLEQIRNDRTA